MSKKTARQIARDLMNQLRANPKRVAATITANNPGISDDDANRLAPMYISVFDAGITEAEHSRRMRAYCAALKEAAPKKQTRAASKGEGKSLPKRGA